MSLRHAAFRSLLVFLPGLACLGIASCDPAGAGPGVGVLFAATTGTGCGGDSTGAATLPADVTRLVVVMRDDGGQELAATTVTAEAAGRDGTVLLQGVPPGHHRLQVAGCTADGIASWWGENPDVRIEASEKSAPVVLMLPSGQLACVGGKNRNVLAPAFQGDDFVVQGRTAFAAAAAGPSGRIVVAGGASSLLVDGTLIGGGAAWEVHPESGLITAIRTADAGVATKIGSRLGHGMAFLDPARVAVFGGALRAVVAPFGFPGAQPPLKPLEAPSNAVEILDLAGGTVAPVTGVDADAWPAVAAAIGTDGIATALAMAGGIGSGGTPSDRVVHVGPATASPFAVGPVLAGTLARPRFGGSAVFLSTGDLLVIGGWDGTEAVPPEIVRTEGGALASSLADGGILPEGRKATAFPAIALLSDDGTTARVLVAGGNPLGQTFAYSDPQATDGQAWELTLTATAGHFGTADAAARATAAGDWAVRSLATLVPFDPAGSSDPGRWLCAGGYRSFGTLADVEDCRDADGTPLDVCFPSLLASFTVSAGGDLVAGWKAPDLGRLGATVVPVRPGTVLVLGGLSGLGGTEPASRVESSGVLAFAGGPAFDAVCAAHPLD